MTIEKRYDEGNFIKTKKKKEHTHTRTRFKNSQRVIN